MEKGAARLGVRRKEGKRRRSKGLVRAVADYLVSDSYLYAPLIDAPPPSEPSTPPPKAHQTPLRTEKGVSVMQLQKVAVNERATPMCR